MKCVTNTLRPKKDTTKASKQKRNCVSQSLTLCPSSPLSISLTFPFSLPHTFLGLMRKSKQRLKKLSTGPAVNFSNDDKPLENYITNDHHSIKKANKKLFSQSKILLKFTYPFIMHIR